MLSFNLSSDFPELYTRQFLIALSLPGLVISGEITTKVLHKKEEIDEGEQLKGTFLNYVDQLFVFLTTYLPLVDIFTK